MNQTFTRWLGLFCLAFTLATATQVAIAQAPANDECTGAISLTINPDLNCGAVTAGTTVGATASPQVDNVTGTPNNDVWFSFTATQTAHRISLINIVNQGGGTSTSTDMGMGLYDGTNGCNALVLSSDSDPEAYTAVGLTPGVLYYLRVYGWSSSIQNNNFNVCVGTLPPPPANDECAGATLIATSPSGACSFVAVSTTAARQSLPNPTCTTTNNNDDVWYSFVAPSNSLKVSFNSMVATSGTATTLGYALYTSCGGTQVACTSSFGSSGSGSQTVTLSPLLVQGQTYLIRVWTGGTNNSANFNLCLEANTVAAPPANDECAGAFSIPVSPQGACSFTSVSTANALQSTPNPTCTSTSNNDDVWFSFNAPSNSLTVSFNSMVAVTGTATSLGYAIYTSCGGTQIACTASFGSSGAGSQTATLSPLLVQGQTYLIRVWTGGTSNSANFNLCLEANTVAAPPANDECAGAFSIPVSPQGACSFTSVSTANALQSTPNPTCTSTSNNDDVWYSFNATSTGLQVSFQNLVAVTGTATQVGYAVYDACNGTQLSCATFGSAGSGTQIVALTSPLTIGSSYRFRTWTGGSANSGTFGLCLEAYTPPPPPSNDECGGAFPIAVDGSAVSGTTISATLSPQPDVCTGTFDDDVWFSFVANGTSVNLSTANVSGATDLAFEILSGSCASLTSLQCSDPENFTITGLTLGQTYFIRVASWSSATATRSTFILTLSSPPAPPSNDDCSGAVAIVVDGPSVTGTTASATNSGIAGACSFASGFDDDVWYSFTATNDLIDVTTSAQTGVTDLVYEVFSGSCTTLTSLQCSDPQSFRITGLTVGSLYYIRVATFSSTNASPAGFTLALTTPPAPPSNDECATALPLFTSAGAPTAANGASYNTTAATNSGVAAPTCAGGTPDDDIWFSIDAQTAGSTLTVTAAGASDFDGVLVVYSGACGSFTELGCADATFGGGTETVTITTSFTGGGSGPSTAPTTYYVRVYDWFTGGGSVTLSATLAPPLPVELAHFSAKAEGKRNVITWTAATETDLSTYVVERATSALDQDFRSVAELAPRGTNGAEAVYTTYDDAPARVSYYRLRTVDLDGSYRLLLCSRRDA